MGDFKCVVVAGFEGGGGDPAEGVAFDVAFLGLVLVVRVGTNGREVRTGDYSNGGEVIRVTLAQDDGHGISTPLIPLDRIVLARDSWTRHFGEFDARGFRNSLSEACEGARNGDDLCEHVVDYW